MYYMTVLFPKSGTPGLVYNGRPGQGRQPLLLTAEEVEQFLAQEWVQGYQQNGYVYQACTRLPNNLWERADYPDLPYQDAPLSAETDPWNSP